MQYFCKSQTHHLYHNTKKRENFETQKQEIGTTIYIHAVPIVYSIYAITFIFVDIETYSSGLNKLLKYKIEIYRVYIERKYKASM